MSKKYYCKSDNNVSYLILIVLYKMKEKYALQINKSRIACMEQKIQFDKKKQCIVYMGGVSSESWDDVWKEQEKFLFKKAKTISRRDRVLRLVHKYVPEGGRILEGGCGLGQFVYSLDKYGYKVTGIDYAEKTVALLNENYPHLDIQLGDVRNLKNFNDEEFDAYYSGGVIEHFYDGYQEIKDEMLRILKKDGVLIITFPTTTKKRLELIKTLPVVENIDQSNFYQFALNLEETIEDFEKSGFHMLHKKIRNGLKGFLEFHPDSKIMNYLYNYKGHNKFIRAIRYIISDNLCKFGYGHTVEIVFKKNS